MGGFGYAGVSIKGLEINRSLNSRGNLGVGGETKVVLSVKGGSGEGGVTICAILSAV